MRTCEKNVGLKNWTKLSMVWNMRFLIGGSHVWNVYGKTWDYVNLVFEEITVMLLISKRLGYIDVKIRFSVNVIWMKMNRMKETCY